MNGPVVCEVGIDAPASIVYELFTDPALLVRWIGISAQLEPVPGGLFRFEIAPGEFCSGTYLELVPDRRVVFTWGWESGALPVAPGSSRVEVDIAGEGERCTVRLEHHGLQGAMVDMHAEGWRSFLARLAAVAEGREPPSDPAAPYQDGTLPEVGG